MTTNEIIFTAIIIIWAGTGTLAAIYDSWILFVIFALSVLAIPFIAKYFGM